MPLGEVQPILSAHNISVWNQDMPDTCASRSRCFSTMASHGLDSLREAFRRLESRTAARRKHLEARLAARQTISVEDEQWLDNEANLVEERHALDILTGASDVETGMRLLTENQKAAMKQLWDQPVEGSDGGVLEHADGPSRKRKRT